MLERLREAFEEKLVYKNMSNAGIFSTLNLPSFLRDWLLIKFSDEDGNYDADELVAFVRENLPSRDSWNSIKNRLTTDGEIVKIIVKINAYIDIKTGEKTFALPDLGLQRKDTLIEQFDWIKMRESHSAMLSDRDTWGRATLAYRQPQLNAKPKIEGKIRLLDFEPFSLYQDPEEELDYYRDVSQDFSSDEWLDILLSAVDYNPAAFDTKTQKLAILTRLLPFLEQNLNLIELAPKGTGKSYLYGRVSRYGWLSGGGKLTRAKMFYDMSSNTYGLIANNDFIVIDEVQTIRCDELEEVQAAFKGYLEQKYCNIGKTRIEAESGLVLSGNIDIEDQNEYRNMFKSLPPLFQESALLDRFHGFIKGWEIPRLTDKVKMEGWGLNTEYFTTMLHQLRYAPDFRRIVNELVKPLNPEEADFRDTEAIMRITTAYLKLLFPYVREPSDVPLDEFREYCFKRALNMRKIVKYQLGLLDPEFEGKNMPEFTIREY